MFTLAILCSSVKRIPKVGDVYCSLLGSEMVVRGLRILTIHFEGFVGGEGVRGALGLGSYGAKG
jgi:hypothetical protein